MINVECYTLKVESNLGPMFIEDVIDFIFSKRYLYYSTKDDRVARVNRKQISKISRRLGSSDKWLPVRPKQFRSNGGI